MVAVPVRIEVRPEVARADAARAGATRTPIARETGSAQQTVFDRRTPVRIERRVVGSELARERIASLEQTSHALRELAAKPTPPGLDPEQVKEAQAYDRWLLKSAREVGDLARRWEHALTGESQEGSDLQMATLDLQSSLQKKQQTLQMMSNMSKLLHDTAMSIIRKMN